MFAVTVAALVGYYLKIQPGPEVYLFIAGLSGGAGIAEVASAFERRDKHKELKELSRQLMKVSEPQLSAAVRVGIAFSTVNGKPEDSRDARFLDVVNELKARRDGNDIFAICDALKTRWGEPVSESFLLGRMLPLVLMPADRIISRETRALLIERLKYRGIERDIVSAVDKAVSVVHEPSERVFSNYVAYMGTLMQYVGRSTTSGGDTTLADRLLGGIDTSEARDASDRGDVTFARFLKKLVEAGIHQSDAEVLLFHGMVENKPEIVEEAIKKGANASITDTELMSRYRSYSA